MTVLGYELKQRGHAVTVLGIEDSRDQVLKAELEFEQIGKSDFPPGAKKEFFAELGNLSGFKAVNYSFKWMVQGAKMCFDDAPEIIQKLGIEALLIDQASFEGGTVAEHLDLPFISVCNALMLNRDVRLPPFNTLWTYDTSWQGILRNKLGYSLLNWAGSSLRKTIQKRRQEWNLPTFRNTNLFWSQLAQVSQQPQEFEFPRRNLPECFHFTGPYHYPNSVTRQKIPFPYEQLTGQPLIYASLGTLQNRLLWVFEMIAETCIGLDAQLVISLGWGTDIKSLPKFPGDPIVVGYAPQLELLKRAALTITHSGMNTTLESLSNGVPMVAIPITNDQPGVANRIAWTKTGEVIPLAKLNQDDLKDAITKVLTDDSYRENAVKMQQAIKRAGGVSRAADIIEQAVLKEKAVVIRK